MDTLNTIQSQHVHFFNYNTVNINYQSWRCTIKQLTLVSAADPTQIMSTTTRIRTPPIRPLRMPVRFKKYLKRCLSPAMIHKIVHSVELLVSQATPGTWCDTIIELVNFLKGQKFRLNMFNVGGTVYSRVESLANQNQGLWLL